MMQAEGRKTKLIKNYVVLDLEMTGLNAKTDVILEVGAVRIREEKVTADYTALLNPRRRLSDQIVSLTGITQDMADGGRDSEEVMTEFFAFLGEDVLIGQNLMFDYSFLKQWAVNHNFLFERQAVDTLKLARRFLPEEEKKDLGSLCRYFGVERRNAHRALDDATETWQIFEALKKRYGEQEDAFVPKPLLYRAKKVTPATERQKQYLKQYANYFGLKPPDELAWMTRGEASRLMDQWILQYGRMPKT